MLLLAGKTTFFCTGFFFFFPGTERLMFSGQETSLSMCCHRSLAAFGLSKLRPARRVWSDERHIVWKAGPDTWKRSCNNSCKNFNSHYLTIRSFIHLFTLYDDKLSIVSLQSVKHVPRSAKRIWIRLLDLDRVSPRSNTTTGIPVNRSSHLSVCDAFPRYKLASDSQTNTCCVPRKRRRISSMERGKKRKENSKKLYLGFQAPEKRFELLSLDLINRFETRLVAVLRAVATLIARRGRGVRLARRR